MKHVRFFNQFQAWIVDFIIISTGLGLSLSLLLVWVANLNFSTVLELLHKGELLEYLILSFVIFYMAYFTFLDLPSSPGKILAKIKLVKTNNSPVTIRESFLRSAFTILSSFILFLPLLMNFPGKLSRTKLVFRKSECID